MPCVPRQVEKLRNHSARPTTSPSCSATCPKSGRPYGLIAAAVLLVVGFATVPVITGVVLAYGYLLAPLLLPVVAPLSRLLPARLKETLS